MARGEFINHLGFDVAETGFTFSLKEFTDRAA
jgi:hypothetical protein